MEERGELVKNELENTIEGKDEEIGELQEKLVSLKEKQDERIVRLEEDIADYEKHIEKINEEKYHEENLEEKYYLLEEKLRKNEKRLHDLENSSKDEKDEFLSAIEKL